jgi:hypothetical protein
VPEHRSDSPPTRPRRSLELALCFLCVAGFVALVVGLGVVVLGRARESLKVAYCYANLGQIGVAIGMYCADHDHRFPLAGNWCDSLEPSCIGVRNCMRCPAAPQVRCGYAYNAALSGFDQSSTKPPNDLVMVWDGLGGWNASGGPELFAPRHRGFGRVLYADGRKDLKKRAELPALRWKP